MQVAAIGIAAIVAGAGGAGARSHYAREGAPVFRAFDDMAATAHGGDRVDADRDARQRAARRPSGRRRSCRRASPWRRTARVADARRDSGRPNPSARVWFVADPGAHRSRRCSIRARAILARALPLGLRRAAVRRRRASQRHRLAAHAAAELDARSRLVDDGRGRRRHGARQAGPQAGARRSPGCGGAADETTVLLGGRHIGAGTATVTVRAERLAARDLRGAATASSCACSRFRRARSTARPAYVPLDVTSVGAGLARAVRRPAARRADVRLRPRLVRARVQPAQIGTPGDGRARSPSCGSARSAGR